MDFAHILASTVHDIKNSLNLVLNDIDQIVQCCSEQQLPSPQQLGQLSYEAKRVNNHLVQLLTLYKINHHQLLINQDYHQVYDFLEETCLLFKEMLKFNQISLDFTCAPQLQWTFDHQLVTGVINNIINNAYRYAKSELLISASCENEWLRIDINDDGPGYPADMLNNPPGRETVSDFTQGNTGLGLYFSQKIAALHQNKNRQGYIRLLNGGVLGGGCFSIYLP